MGYPTEGGPDPPPGGYNQGFSNPPQGYGQPGPTGYSQRPHALGPYKMDNPKKHPQDVYDFMKYLMFSYNLLFFLCACTLLAVGIWMAVDRSFMATITGEPLYAVAAYVIIAGGAIMLIITFMGCCGAISENRILLWIYFATHIVILVILLLAGILAIVFRTQIGEAVQDTMRDTLTNYYGVDLYERKNKAITNAWDRAQERLGCCSVLDEGWVDYHGSKWFDLQPHNPEDKKAYVPKSCCVRDRFHRYVNEEICMKWDMGPPKQQSGAKNRALYYEGCYSAGKRYLIENSNILIGLGFAFIFVLILGTVLSYMLIRRIP